ncbi:MAG: hypothetical protein FJ090_12215 [Deltaproteobacteria bacterium]|nr:hypothetical protein [Deltaproteobacteria bacterium]
MPGPDARVDTIVEVRDSAMSTPSSAAVAALATLTVAGPVTLDLAGPGGPLAIGPGRHALPPGDYRGRARFDESGRDVATPIIALAPGGAVTLSCDAQFTTCVVR